MCRFGSFTDISSSVLIDRLGGIKSGPRRDVASDCGQKELLLLGSRVFRGFPTSDFVFPTIFRSICLCREIKKCAVWQSSDKVLEIDGFCVRNAAQSFLRLDPKYTKSHPKNRGTRKSSVIHCNSQGGGAGFDETTVIPNHSIRSCAAIAIIVNLNTRDSNHEFVEFRHNGIYQGRVVRRRSRLTVMTSSCCRNLPRSAAVSAPSLPMRASNRKKCVERYCELANKTTQQLYKVSTPCIDGHHFKEEEMKSVGELSQVCSQIVLKCLYLERIGRPDILWSVNKLARSITKWTKACHKRLNRLISYIHHTCE